MSEELIARLRSQGPVSPAVQMRELLEYGRQRGWLFEVAWRWSFERVKWPHDTTHRLEWKAVLGQVHDDPRVVPARHREVWRSAYERHQQTSREESVGKLLVAA